MRKTKRGDERDTTIHSIKIQAFIYLYIYTHASCITKYSTVVTVQLMALFLLLKV